MNHNMKTSETMEIMQTLTNALTIERLELDGIDQDKQLVKLQFEQEFEATTIEYQMKYEMMGITQTIKDANLTVLVNQTVGTVQEEQD